MQQHRLILVADDNKVGRIVVLRQLELLGYAAGVAGNGREALRMWSGGDFALLLTDLYLPEMNGCQLAAAVRAGGNDINHVPILAYCMNITADNKTRAIESGIDECLRKPVPFQTLKAKLEKWLPSTAVQTAAGLPVDLSVLAGLVGDDPAVISRFLNDFRAFATNTAEELMTAFGNGDAAQVGALTHKLKSSARSVGALKLGELCADIEQMAKAGQIESLTDLMRRFTAEMDAVSSYLDSL